MADLRWSIDKSVLWSLFSGISACAIAAYCLKKSHQFRYVATASTQFPDDYLCLSCCFSAFLTARLICGFLLCGRPTPKTPQAAGALLASALGVALAPLTAGFPPYAAFLCRLLCPESLYYPKPCASMRGDIKGRDLRAEELLSLLEALLLFGMGYLPSNIVFARTSQGLLCLLAVISIIALLCFRYFKQCRDKPPKRKERASVVFRSLWLSFWAFPLFAYLFGLFYQ